MSQLINTLIHENENLYLEFKLKWYWEKNEKPSQREWGEFLKDFVSLVNCSEEFVEDVKYLIIGVDESKQGNSRFRDVDLIEDERYKDLNNLKQDIIQKIKTFFRLESNIQGTYENFSINTHIVDNKQILVFEINPCTSLLVLDKDLTDKKRTEKKNNVFVRQMKKIGDPEVFNASPEKLKTLNDTIQIYKKRRKKEEKKEKSIEKTITLFVQNNDIYELETPKKEKIWKENILFELYPVKSEFINIDFIYIDDKTSQQKTYKYLKSNNFLTEDAQRWVIIDSGLKKDIAGIKVKFDAHKVYSLDNFAFEHLYKKYFNDNIYHDGNFKKQEQIKNFIKPFTSSSKKNAFVVLSDWFDQVSKPLMVIKGYGGIGKTTLVKFFLDEIFTHYKSTNLNSKILFIDSKEIINEISKQNKVNNVYDFYSALAKEKNLEKKLGQELLELSVDNGNLLIVLDGIDEVIAKLVNKFDIENFIDTIYNNYSLGNEKTKIIITCRDYFWNDSINSNYSIDTLELEPFNEKLAKDFFMKQFLENTKEFDKCMSLAKEFALSDNDEFSQKEEIYIPYILDVIMDMVKQQKELGTINRSDIESKLLNSQLTNDYFVGRMCNREIVKLDNLSIDLQLEFFIKMAMEFNGIIPIEQIKKAFSNIKTGFSDSLVEKFKGHPLISYENNAFRFRYDFFRDFFLNLYVSQFFISQDKTEMSEEFSEILIEHIKYDNSFTKFICKRINFNDNFQLFIINIIEELIVTLKEEDSLKTRTLVSSMLTLLLVSLKESKEKNDIERRTQLLVDIFGEQLDYLTIINLFGANNPYPTFDFTNRYITNAWFDNYEYFWECKICTNTSFDKSIFKYLTPRDNITIPKIHHNLFRDNCDISGIQQIIIDQEMETSDKKEIIKRSILKIFRHFEQSGTFKDKKIDDTRKKCDTRILDKLIKNNVIETFKNPNRPTLKQYRVTEEYHNILKVLSQEGTCVEFEKVLKFFE